MRGGARGGILADQHSQYRYKHVCTTVQFGNLPQSTKAKALPRKEGERVGLGKSQAYPSTTVTNACTRNEDFCGKTVIAPSRGESRGVI